MKHYDDGDWQDPYIPAECEGVDLASRCVVCGAETEDIYCSRACEIEDLRLSEVNGRHIKSKDDPLDLQQWLKDSLLRGIGR